jgi:hypothetical protein
MHKRAQNNPWGTHIHKGKAENVDEGPHRGVQQEHGCLCSEVGRRQVFVEWKVSWVPVHDQLLGKGDCPTNLIEMIEEVLKIEGDSQQSRFWEVEVVEPTSKSCLISWWEADAQGTLWTELGVDIGVAGQSGEERISFLIFSSVEGTTVV